MLEKLKRNQNSEQRLEESFHSKKANQSVFGKTFYKDDKDALVSHVHQLQQKQMNSSNINKDLPEPPSQQKIDLRNLERDIDNKLEI